MSVDENTEEIAPPRVKPNVKHYRKHYFVELVRYFLLPALHGASCFLLLPYILST